MRTIYIFFNQRSITQKLRKGEQSSLYMTHRLDLIHIPIKLHEDMATNYGVYKNFWNNNNQRGIT